MRTIIIYCLLLLPSFSIAQSETHFFVHFDFDKYVLKSEAKSSLDSFIKAVRIQNKRISITLNGHCDSVGNDVYNDKLSIKRVNAVKNYIASQFGFTLFTKIVGHGKREPLNRNTTDEERMLNRRVEILTIIRADTVTKEDQDKINKFTSPPPYGGNLRDQLEDTALKAGTNIVLKNIYFVGARHELLPESLPVLEELLAVMKKHRTLKIEIRGHICCLPGNVDGYDEQTGTNNLSEERAKAVWQYLYDKGILLERIYYIGMGHSQPIYPYPEKNEDEKTGNRRVEIRILSK